MGNVGVDFYAVFIDAVKSIPPTRKYYSVSVVVNWVE